MGQDQAVEVLAPSPGVRTRPIDLILLGKRTREVEAMLRAIQPSDPDSFAFKVILICTERYLVINAIDEGMALLALLPEEYLSSDLPQQMQEDPIFYATAARVADILVEEGIVRPTVSLDLPAYVVHPGAFA